MKRFKYNNTQNNSYNIEKFNYIYKKFYLYAYKVTFNIVHNSSQIDDIMQEIFINVWKILNNVNEDINLKALIATIARNTAINFLKKDKYRTDKMVDIDDEASLFILSRCDNEPLNTIVAAENIEFIYKQIKSLKKIYADILLLKYKFDFTPEMISKLLNIKLKTVYTRLSRGENILREKLKLTENIDMVDQYEN